ncbi:tRNA uracil 4-sulfurtransferase ThiI [uncultured Methanoregula sp.]|uniref:tRNA uracil 4-sulfurtransferase ThiI n=1 Tax=uncultured Methanoregula sp. TaxID=1005933 RepID=UPI002AAAFE58|nr:tRNA uracil 4-sulfurtransferase ThiI [uncultured Methanoregula sp.]
MKKQWLVRYSEIFLKSDPVRRQWENTLIANIREVMPGIHVRNERGRIWLDGDVKPDLLKNVFGIVSFSEVEHIKLDEISTFLPGYCRRHGIENARTFAIKMKRVGKHNFSSNDKAIEYGNLVRNTFPHLKVNLAYPDKEIHIEIRSDEAYLYDTVIKGPGGLPLGVEGSLVALVSGGIDSPVAAWMMMKRGCRILPVFIALDTFLDETTAARAQRVVDVLAKYQPGIKLTVIHDGYLAAAKTELVRRGLEKYTCIFCKRRMYRVVTEFAKANGAKGIVTGESLGQVASQTLDNLLVLTDAASDVPIHRPLIGYDKEETMKIARDIGTFPESTSKASGCRAVPAGPSTKAKLETIREIETKLKSTEMPLPV